MFQVIKRDGSKADFTLTKINDAIMKAFTATQMSYNNDIIDLLALRVTADFQKKVENDEIHVEDIQDSVERVLGQAGYEEVAKAYILYRKQREKMRAMKSTILDYKDVVNSYVKVEDWRVKENSTVTYSVGGLILSNSGAVTANYWLSEIYDEEIAEAHRNADIHIHDLSMLTGYCAGWSLKQLIKEGLGGITGKITSAPARHLSVLCNQRSVRGTEKSGRPVCTWRKTLLFSSEQAYKHNGNAPCFSCGGNDMHGDIGDVPEICA